MPLVIPFFSLSQRKVKEDFFFGGSERGRGKKKKQFVSPSIKKQILGDRILTRALDRKTSYLLLVYRYLGEYRLPLPPLSPLLS